MIFVVEAIGRRWCGRFVQRIAPVLALTRIAAGAVIRRSPACCSLGAAGSRRRAPAANGARVATCCSEAAARSSASDFAETSFGVSVADWLR
jgi:hypothetical protein